MPSCRNNPQRKRSGKNKPHNKETPVSDRLYRTTADIPLLLKTTDLLIVNKPAGIPVHGSYSIDTLLSGASVLAFDEPPAPTSVQTSSDMLLTATPHKNGRGCLQSLSFKPGPLHRLDKDTTGVLCFSRTLAGAQWFSQCLREKTIGKYYLGVVRGAMPAQRITAQDESGTTVTQCYSIGYGKDIDASLMLFRLITGKKHQIRKHTMSVGHPLAGDRKYNGGNPFSGCTRYLLHAWRLCFPDSRPADVPVFIEAPLFPEMETCLNRYFSGWRKKVSAILANQCYDKSNSNS